MTVVAHPGSVGVLAVRTLRRWRLWTAVGTATLLSAIMLLTVYNVAERRAMATLEREQRMTAQLQLAALESELQKQRSAPSILADDSDVRRSLADPSPERSLAISRKLSKLKGQIGSAALYVLDARGVALSSSTASRVGTDYSHRPYFEDVMRAGSAEQFGLGTVKQFPGLYDAHRVDLNGRPLGVVVTVVKFAPMEATWRRDRTTTFVSDNSGRIALTSIPGLRFATLPATSPDTLETTLPTSDKGWRLTVIGSRGPARQEARSATLIAALALALLASLAAWMWRRRRLVTERAAAEALYRARLERDVASRTHELSDSNTRLSAEIHERQFAEHRLNMAQADLVQANKLAQLGQITAGVAHEVNQPLATIRALAENARKMIAKRKTDTPSQVDDNLDSIVRMSERIAHITGELRAFSRKATGDSITVSLKQTIDSSILLNKSRLRHNRVRLIRETIGAEVRVVAGRIRLEQVIVNLLQNACEALEDTADPVVNISASVDDDWVWLRIRDNGPGLDPRVLSQLFTPFVTTKENGLGLGLVIAHDIMRDFGGDLNVEQDGPGACFTLKLKKVA